MNDHPPTGSIAKVALGGMSYTRKFRLLGHTRSLGSPERVRFPPLQSPEQQIIGVQGNAMNVPPQKMTVDRIVPSRAKSETTADQADYIIKEKERHIREIMSREGQIKKQIIALQEQIQEMTTASSLKENTIKNMQLEIEQALNQKSYWKEKYNTELALHKSTKNSLKNEQQKVEDLHVATETQKQHHEKLILMHEAEFADMENKKNQEIEERDVKLKRLKTQIADTLQGNSWERQQQIDELSKELQQANEEAEALRIKLKKLSKNSEEAKAPSTCQNCKDLTAQLAYENILKDS